MDTVKPKILVYGHSWVRSMGRLHDTLDLSNLIVHYEGRPRANIERLLEDLPNVLTEDYTHMMLFTLISEMYLNENLADSRHNKDFWVTYPNMAFSLDGFVQSLDRFIKRCEELKPNMAVHLMVPPPLDLNYYNELQLRDAPSEIVKTYQHNPRFKKFQVAHNVLQLNYQARMLGRQQYRWDKKQVFVIQNAIYDIQIACIKTAMHSFYQKEVHTMGKDSYLIDGFHPSSLLVSKIWKRLIETGRFVLKKRKLPEPLVMKVTPLNEYDSQDREFMNVPVEGAQINTMTDIVREYSEESKQLPSSTSEIQKPHPLSQTTSEASANKKIKLSDNSALDEFVETETERLIYYILGYTTGKGLNYSTNDVAALISKYLANRE